VRTWLAVAAGGAIGAAARHALNAAVHRSHLASVFPTGILLVNVVGSLAIGTLAGLLVAERVHLGYDGRVFLIVGVLGGFTTFSSFTFDTLALVREGRAGLAAWNVAGNVALGLLAVFVGFRLGLGR
jgi:CrcB protein